MGETEKETVHINRSRFEIYCEKLKINPNLFMLKVTLFMMYGGKNFSFQDNHFNSITLLILTYEQINLLITSSHTTLY